MKFLKKAGIVILVLIIIWNILALFGPKMVHVERSMVMNAEAKTIFEQLNTLKNWKKWSYWDQIDTVTMKDSWEGPESGVGCKHGWDSPNDSVGKGSLTITKSEPDKFVETELYFDGMGTSIGGWKIADTNGARKVTTYMDMNVMFLMRPMMLFMNMDKMLGPDFEKSLSNLNNYSGKIKKEAAYKIEEKDQPSMMILTIRDTLKSMSDIGPTLGKRYGEIGAQMKKGGGEMAGPVFAIYHHFSPEMIDMESGVQVNKKIEKTTGRVKYRETKAGKTVVLDYYGAYDKMQPAYDQIDQWAKDNNKKLSSESWEIYAGDPGIEKDPAKILTQVVFFIE